MKKYIIFLLQIMGLYVINEAGYLLVKVIHLPIPGNVVGMIILFLLLVTGIIKEEWIKEAATFLTKHLSFFFIPIGVTLMGYGDLLVSNLVAFLAALIGSLAVGLLVSGRLSQLTVRKEDKKDESRAVNVM